ncbi:MAG: S-layer homology domain-containing protein [Oscillospiraceae bacterium]|nr:S-layer homology domain-containing protein [Oscillospiraceae bacterium]
MAATILWRTAGEPTATGGAVFTDVAAGRWYTAAIAWANENGIVLGVGGNRFDPTANVTREQFAAMMYRYAAFTGGDTSVPAGFDLSQFQDRDQLNDWAERYLYWANYNELITGRTPTTLAPQGTATRAEAAGIVTRFVAAFG